MIPAHGVNAHARIDLTQDDIRDSQIAHGRMITRRAGGPEVKFDPPTYTSDTYLCGKCHGPRKADTSRLYVRKRTTVDLECGHRAFSRDICAPVIP